MTISCYTNNESPETFPKTPTLITGYSSITIDPLSVIDELSPVFVVSYNSALLACNYIKCDDLGRYYFARKSIDTAGRIVFTCSVDYLNSWAAEILACDVTVVRNSDIIPNMYPDKQLPIIPTVKDVTSIVLSNDLFSQSATKNYALITIG